MTEEEDTVAKLRMIPSVSEKCAKGLYLLGIREIDDLKGKNAADMYSMLRERKDFFAEPCMLNMIKIAVGMANKGMENIAKMR
ncbi:MAG: helix-hairpin-helix domain-containing protein [Methanomassiliicoccaceae archaeon]|nr:helix-hairpin-helix domain-containing protein [Methanomassiliicoccaceae archaeon]